MTSLSVKRLPRDPGPAAWNAILPVARAPLFTYASMTRALTPDEVLRLGGMPRWGATPADPMGTTVRCISGTGGDRIVTRNRFTMDPSMEVSEARIALVGRDHDRAFAARFPMLAGVGMEYRWGGRLCLSRNNVAAFGEVEQGLYAACCQNGWAPPKALWRCFWPPRWPADSKARL